ncbi:Hypothetical predicted protein [Lecanosticta acicola]|uniref:Regulator of volume decrease after cellular swelling-domain-containing protein n=1 Tax=Lecanosticta acicola TaxID=111012 RepID=A0AAI8YZ40_9PEZI|nr:Hypothetical predicted protein [Lecanosticta acicola]
MAFETIDTTPAIADFALLSEHQEQTPRTFFGGRPVLHLQVTSSTIKISHEQFAAQPDLKRLTGGSNPPASAEDGILHIAGVDVWVSSRNLTLFSPAHTSGLQIPYQTITVTAQEGQAVLLELNLSDADTPDEELEFVQLRILPGAIERHAPEPAPESEEQAAGAGANGTTTTHNRDDAATALFRAISDCQELNPDPDPSEDGDGEDFLQDQTAPGAGGWITSENMADFMDENGNFRMPEGMTVVGGGGEEEAGEANQLGEGAGRTRTAAELDAEDGAPNGDETKWQRTS